VRKRKRKGGQRGQGTDYAECSAFSLVVEIGTSPTPHPQASVHLPPPLVPERGAQSLAREGWESPNSNVGTSNVVLFTYMYFVGQGKDGVCIVHGHWLVAPMLGFVIGNPHPSNPRYRQGARRLFCISGSHLLAKSHSTLSKLPAF
jgi:hypothetical protein